MWTQDQEIKVAFYKGNFTGVQQFTRRRKRKSGMVNNVVLTQKKNNRTVLKYFY